LARSEELPRADVFVRADVLPPAAPFARGGLLARETRSMAVTPCSFAVTRKVPIGVRNERRTSFAIIATIEAVAAGRNDSRWAGCAAA